MNQYGTGPLAELRLAEIRLAELRREAAGERLAAVARQREREAQGRLKRAGRPAWRTRWRTREAIL